jgi:hypothetical protein
VKKAGKKGAAKKVARAAKKAVKKVVAAARKKVAKRAPSERDSLVMSLAKKLGIGSGEVELRALRELSERTSSSTSTSTRGGGPAPSPQEFAAVQTAAFGVAPSGLPRRLFLLLDGRGLEGHGIPVEVIDSPTVVGSGKFCTVWINAPQIETRHLQIAQDGDNWVLTDLGSEKGTLLGDERIQRRVIQHGDEYRLAGYLRLRTELR